MQRARPSARPHDKRHHPRRAKSIRFGFDHGGDQHRAVSTIVSLGGAFLKASHIPAPGAVLTLHERFNPDGVEIAVRCEVVWLQDQPTLERPDTGFGVRFIEAVTRADPSHLEDFLRGLDPTHRGYEITFEERAQGAHAVFRFPFVELLAERFREDERDFAELDEPAIIDLDRELERLGREERRHAPDLAPAPSALEARAPEATPAPPSSPDSPLPSPPPLAALAAGGDTKARAPKKRRVTGIFTALFSRGKGPEQPIANTDPTPSVPPAERARTPDDRRPRVALTWSRGVAEARVETLGRDRATLWTAGRAPEAGDTLELRPIGTPPALERLVIRATVESVDERRERGTVWLTLRYERFEETTPGARFADYFAFVNGPRSVG